MSGIAGRRRIYLMRHGHVDYFDPEITDPRMVKLTPEGEEQAAAARDALSHISFDITVTSGLPRTEKTCEIVMKGHETLPEHIISQGLEELKSGWIQAKSREELAARLAYGFDGACENGASFLEDGEPFAAAQSRVTRALTDLLLTKSWRSALIVAHEGVNRIALGWACGGGLSTISSFEQDLCCVNVIDVDVTPGPEANTHQIERVIIKAMNITPYDYVKNGLSRSSLEHLFDVDFGLSRPAIRPD